MFCAAIPVAGAVGAKLNAEEKRKVAQDGKVTEKHIPAVTTGVILMLLTGSVIYHTTFLGR